MFRCTQRAYGASDAYRLIKLLATSMRPSYLTANAHYLSVGLANGETLGFPIRKPRWFEVENPAQPLLPFPDLQLVRLQRFMAMDRNLYGLRVELEGSDQHLWFYVWPGVEPSQDDPEDSRRVVALELYQEDLEVEEGVRNHWTDALNYACDSYTHTPIFQRLSEGGIVFNELLTRQLDQYRNQAQGAVSGRLRGW